jgi:high-affinity iron transporter
MGKVIASIYLDYLDLIDIITANNIYYEVPMLPAILLSLREGIEIALVIGIAQSTLQKLNRGDLKRMLWFGAASAALVSFIVALILNQIGAEFEGVGEQIFEGSAMLFAATLLTWMIFWMRHTNSRMKSAIEAEVRASSSQGGFQLFFLAFTSVMRDGIELALFLFAAKLASDPLQSISGAVIGLAIAAALGWGIFTSSLKMDVRRFFTITNVLLILFAAGLVGRGIHEFNEAALIPAGIESLWNLSAFLSEESPIGQVLTTLFGYSSSPSLSMTLGYTGYLIVMVSVFWYGLRSRQRLTRA